MFHKELQIFLIVGFLTAGIDYAFYQILLQVGSFPLTIAKAFGFLVGTIFSYFANRYWTFNQRHSTRNNIVRFYILYGLSLGLNVISNSLIMTLFSNLNHVIQFAFIVAIGLSATLNFIGMRFFVFTPAGKK
jgi:putative flippase GtrA